MATGGVVPRAPHTGLESYAVNNVVDGNPLYVGKVQPDGNWIIQKYDSTAGTMTYANFSNNPGVIGYGVAWTNHTTLIYGTFDTLVGV